MSEVQENAAQDMAAEQASERAALMAAVGEAEAMQAQASGQTQEVQVQPDLADELTGLIMTVTMVLRPIFPSLGTVYTPEVTGAAAGSIAAVCQKHGWLQNGVMGQWGVEIGAAAVLLPLGVSTFQAVRLDLETLKRKREAEGKGRDSGVLDIKPDGAPVGAGGAGADRVTVGEVVT